MEMGRGRWGIGNTWPKKRQFHKSVTLNPLICVPHISAGSLPPLAQGQLQSLLFFSLSLFDKLSYIQLSWKKIEGHHLFLCTTPQILANVHQKCILPVLQSDLVTGRS